LPRFSSSPADPGLKRGFPYRSGSEREIHPSHRGLRVAGCRVSMWAHYDLEARYGTRLFTH
ncbi:MAG: hypothetical protein VW443_10520, partial [Pseudomonadales bacterium]